MHFEGAEMMFKKGKQYDFLKQVKWMGILLAAVMLTNLGVCLYAISAISDETSKYADSVVLSYVREVQQMLDNIDNTIATEILYDTKLDTIQDGKDIIEVIQANLTVKNLLASWAHQYALPVNHMIYFPGTETTITGSREEKEYAEWRRIEKELISMLVEKKGSSEDSEVGEWNVVNLQGKNYILKYYYYKGRYIGSWIEIDKLIDTMVAEGLGKECLFVVSSASGKAYNSQERLEEKGLSIPASIGEKLVVRDFLSPDMIVNEPVKGTTFSLNAVILGYSQVAGALSVQIALTLIVVMIAAACLVFMLYIRRTLIKPIQDFSNNIRKFREDNTYTVETHYQIAELANASEILADLVKQINGLKIDIYERTLEQQKVKMDFLTLQIEPHFYLNCLNIIYHMTEIKKYKEVQNLSQCVSDYLRYIFKTGNNMVLLGEELEHTKKYLEIQKIRYRDGFEAVIEVEEEVLGVKVPPLLLQTFVENALKHTIDWEEEITISLRGRKMSRGKEDYIQIEVEDSGEGFEEEILRKLQHGIDISEGEKRIGIMNAVQRLHLQYGDRAKVCFYNRPEGGAGVRIQIPIKERKEGGE